MVHYFFEQLLLNAVAKNLNCGIHKFRSVHSVDGKTFAEKYNEKIQDGEFYAILSTDDSGTVYRVPQNEETEVVQNFRHDGLLIYAVIEEEEVQYIYWTDQATC